MAGGGERKRRRMGLREKDMMEMEAADEADVDERRHRKKKKKRMGSLQRRQKLLPGEKVEVLISDEGLRGSWHEAVVIECKKRSRLVEYTYLYDDDSKSKLRESIPVKDAIAGLSTKTLKNYRGNLRPLAPPSPEIQACEVKYGMCVDAWMDDAWWEGVVFDHKEGQMERLVFFPDNGDQHMFMIHQLRYTRKWNEVSGRWKMRGEWILLQVLKTFVDGEGLPVSTREIWYDLRSMLAFQKTIGLWIFGSQRDWHPLVSALIEELVSVSNGVVVVNATDSNRSSEACATSGARASRKEIPRHTSTQNTSENLPLTVFRDSYLEEKITEGSHSEEVWRRGDILANLDKYPKVLSDFIAYFYTRVPSHPSSSGEKPVYALRDKARAFLFSEGWEFKPTCYNHYYFSPDGTKFCTLAKACVAWLSFKKSEGKKAMSCEETGTCVPYNPPPVVSNDIIERRKKRPVPHTRLRKKDFWQPWNIKAEYCPQAIELCSRGSKSIETWLEGSESTCYSVDDLFLQARKHLVALGWKVERYKRKKLRNRLTSPEGVCFYSLQKACLYLMDSHVKKSSDNTCKNNSAGDELCFGSDVVSPVQGDLLHYSLIKEGKYGRVCLTKGGAPMKRVDKGRKRLLPKKISESVFDDNIRDEARERPHNEIMLLDNSKLEAPMSKDANAIYFPETLIKYKDYCESLKAEDKQKASRQEIIRMRLDAQRCIISKGWTHCKKAYTPSSHWTYYSPDGTRCRSLYAACRMCLEDYQGTNTVRFLEGRNTKKLRDARLEDPAIKNHHFGAFTSGLPQKNTIKDSRNKCHELKFGLPCHTGRGISKKKCSFFTSKNLHARIRGKKIGYYCQISGRRKSSQLVNGHQYRLYGKSLVRSIGRQAHLFGSTLWKNTKSTLSALIDNDIVILRQKVQYIEKRNGRVLMEGRITRDGIKCDCCKMLYSLTKFEVHAGNNSCRPAEHLFLLDGRSLRQCQMQMMDGSVKRFLRGRTKNDYSSYPSDATCSICRFGGKLVLCDYCPSSFHTSCLGLEGVPEGKWCCATCRCRICGVADFNSNNKQFTENTIIFCDQCERQYHVGCLRNTGFTELENCPTGNWFCSNVCSEIFLALCKLVGKCKPTSLDGLSWSILRPRNEKGMDTNPVDFQEVAEQNSKRHLALKILQECFLSIPESRTSSDIISDIIFNNESELNRLNFGGFYTMVLERGDEMISVATFRVLGNKAAELPLVGTRVKHRRQGMCRLLMDELEKFLFGFGVERLILPAVPQLLETWTTSFGFSEMTNSDILELGEYTFINFQGSTLCQKFLSNISKGSGENCNNLSIVGGAMSSVSNNSFSHGSEAEPHKRLPFVGIQASFSTKDEIEGSEFGHSMIDTPIAVKMEI